MPTNQEMEKYFGQVFTERARDWTMRDFDKVVNHVLNGTHGPFQWSFAALIAELGDTQREALRRLVLYMVDTTLHNTMFMFEEYDNIHISVEHDGTTVHDLRDVASGLQGYVFSWAEEFSNEPKSD